MTQQADCLFCRIVRKEIPSQQVYADDRVTVFRDIEPQAPQHLLIVPNEHIENAGVLEPEHDALVGRLVRTAAQVAEQAGVADSGYRLVVNVGRDALNSVPHLHVHLLGGRRFGWPPG